ncbi:WcaF family extracellular polysaccharide biosynthesis acetyltransferase [Botrimarina sp.]|uniref:WcaF family extracellular polysaccharide biosynthesis acetyltransferase n=1 Tax=Botrimarina sp. TaxID=2795802 RepID=UPI0032EF0EB0
MPKTAPPAESPQPPPAEAAWVDLSGYTPGDYRPGRGAAVRVAWYLTSVLLFESGLFPVTRAKPALLRLFGARIGRGVVIKPNVRIKYPWRLTVGDHVWIGQEAWIDNLADVRIGDHVCVSQRVYLCTGSHDHRRRGFDLKTGPITLENGAWVAAGAIVLGGVRICANSIVAAGAVVGRDTPAGKIVGGAPARVLADRRRPEQ